eukprot:scaffold58690_cov64-Phaeocystis_antarctica.AAC.1
MSRCARFRRRLAIRSAWVACTQCWMVGRNPSRPRCGKAHTHSSSPTLALEMRLVPLATLALAMALAFVVTKPVISEAIWHMHSLASRLILTPAGRLCAMTRVTLVTSKTERRAMGGSGDSCAPVTPLTTTAAGVGCVGGGDCSGSGGSVGGGGG